ncbi:MAG TPA: SagB/ThcOx family dehydrogenase [Candidatus Dormibacteraeota bacterium]|nr:SagB/ThcOx family dehydrogenase [Candidatus Dormibacteraeota bacterium]
MTWNGRQQLLIDGVTGGVFKCTPGLIRALDAFSDPAEADDSTRSLVDAGLLVPASASRHESWSTFELVVQRMSGGGGRRARLSADRMPPPSKPREADSAPPIPLPRARRMNQARLASVLRHRRSHREFAAGDVALARLGELLTTAAGVHRAVPMAGVSYRAHASAGGRHPLEIYVGALHVPDLDRGVYRFDPFDGCLHRTRADPRRLDRLPDELGSAMNSELPVEPAAVLLITAVFGRTMWKYEDIGLSLIYKDTGALLQTLHLVAQALGLAGCAVHLRGEAEIAAWLGLDPMAESLVSCFAVGLPAG